MQSGLQTDLAQWQIMDDAFASLNNAYIWRGRLRKRFGSMYMGIPTTAIQAPYFSRLRTTINAVVGQGITTGAGAAAHTAPGAPGHVGQAFSIGDILFTVFDPAAGPRQMLRSDGLGAVATYDLATGAYDIAGAPINSVVYFYPDNPVMGITNYRVGAINNQPTIAFDTQYAYQYGNGWDRIGTAVWRGNNSQFFWTSNYRGILEQDTCLFVTNFQATLGVPAATDDPIYFWNGAAWTNFSPSTVFLGPADPVAPNSFVFTCRIIVQFHRRLLLLNTIEQNPAGAGTNYAFPQRCRFSINGSPVAANAWLEQNQVGTGGAGYIDAATKEKIISAEFIRDRLIVYFERSTWELAYTGNEIEPFRWQKLNTELGAEATFSRIPFDKVVLAIGNTGVHACNGVNVERIDNKIPSKIFQIQNKNEGVSRAVGIRDYYTEMVYWTFPSIDSGAGDIFPNRVLVYNYNTGTWAFNDDCITMFGYFEQQQDATWASTDLTWDEYNASWNSGVLQSQFRQVIAGNQQGFTFIVAADVSRNAHVMQITDLTPSMPPPIVGVIEVTATVINHTVHPQDYLQIKEDGNITGLDGVIIQVKRVVNANEFVFDSTIFNAVYIGGAFLSRVSRIFAQSKQWNPYLKFGNNVTLNKIDFAVKKSSNGQVLVDYSPSATQLSLVSEGMVTNSQIGSNVLETYPYGPLLNPIYPLESEQATLWHPIYFYGDGQFIQITILLNDAQMRNPDIAFEDFVLEGLILHTQPSSSRL